MVEKTENTDNTSLSQEEAAKQAAQLAKEIKKLKAQLKKKTTPTKAEERTIPTKTREKKKTTPTKAEERTIPTKTREKKKTTPTKAEERTIPTKTREKKKTTPTKAEEKKTFEEELEEQLTDEEIENFQIAKVDMDKLTNKVTEILAKYESDGMLQSELWKKLKLTSRDGSRLALKLERMGIISREKILENGRWTYKLIIKKTPISTTSIENAPCLTCPVEQKCTLDGEISPRTCKWIEDWVLVQITQSKKKK